MSSFSIDPNCTFIYSLLQQTSTRRDQKEKKNPKHPVKQVLCQHWQTAYHFPLLRLRAGGCQTRTRNILRRQNFIRLLCFPNFRRARECQRTKHYFRWSGNHETPEFGKRNLQWLRPGGIIQVCQQDSPLPCRLWLHTSAVTHDAIRTTISFTCFLQTWIKTKLKRQWWFRPAPWSVLHTYSQCNIKCAAVDKNKGARWHTPTSMECFSDRSFGVFLSLSSCLLHKSALTIIKNRSLLCTLQVVPQNVLHFLIWTIQGHRSREL